MAFVEDIEAWMPVLGYEGVYEVSDQGRVRSLARRVPRGHSHLTIAGKLLKPAPHIVTGYNVVRLSRDGDSVLARVPVLVCEAFHGPRPTGKQAAHRNGVRTDDRADNLEWLTRRENDADKDAHGTRLIGEQSPVSILTVPQVHEIRRLRSLGGTYQQIADRLGVTFEMVRSVIVGRSWAHLKESADGV